MVSLSEKINFSAEEDKILELWKKIDAFKRSLELTKDKPEVRFVRLDISPSSPHRENRKTKKFRNFARCIFSLFFLILR